MSSSGYSREARLAEDIDPLESGVEQEALNEEIRKKGDQFEPTRTLLPENPMQRKLVAEPRKDATPSGNVMNVIDQGTKDQNSQSYNEGMKDTDSRHNGRPHNEDTFRISRKCRTNHSRYNLLNPLEMFRITGGLHRTSTEDPKSMQPKEQLTMTEITTGKEGADFSPYRLTKLEITS
ncbi:hypothetical protein U1Q18_022637 [Sarracenia purpurea var. burkii]